MKFPAICVLSLAIMASCGPPRAAVQGMVDDYVTAWKEFQPSDAFAAGAKEAAFRFESVSPGTVEAWVAFNAKTLERLRRLPGDLALDDRADADLLERQAQSQLDAWREDRIHASSPAFYAGTVSQALTHILAREDLDPPDRWRAVESRLTGVRRLCEEGLAVVRDGRPQSTERSVRGMESAARFLEERLPGIVEDWPGERPAGLDALRREAASAVRSLAAHVRDSVLPAAALPDALGRAAYAPRLKTYTGLDISPEELEDVAALEIAEVRSLMAVEAGLYHEERYPGKTPPASFDELVGSAIGDMEENRESDQAGFLRVFEDLIERSETFIRDKGIATIPEPRTLWTALSPAHFAGAAVGGVYSAGPFNPGADTLFYLPTVPDDAPENVKEGFYRSFNNHFNTVIIPHEITPGHYMQLKIAASLPRTARSLFSDPLYVEGWATLCEVIALDAGWNGHDRLDRLAHLRKRLENAVRAYTSVQVHCRGWDRDRLMAFAVTEGLLAPQFAINLWDRVIDSPFQITSYFLGFREMTRLLEREKAGRGPDLDLRAFCDGVLGAGAVPIALLPEMLRSGQ
ncbi:MAG: DUF885 domain-containing protein [Candidatus Aminicenantes bacterium]|nr:DUF885 domain-containing protein [Candidatus Aminicenantes bacterium]